MRVLDLFAGLGGWSAPFRDRGHEVVTIDYDPRFETTYTRDLMEPLPTAVAAWGPEIVLASPPCEKFSLLAIGSNWLPGYEPRHVGTRLAMALVERTVGIVEALQPSFWVIENPVGMLRKLDLIPYERQTVTYCQYGAAFRKPTDLWGGFPPSWEPKPRCRNYAGCRVSAPRGSRTGIQGDAVSRGASRKALEIQKRQARQHYGATGRELAALRAVIPYDLALAVCIAAERDLEIGRPAIDYTGRLFA